MYERIPDELKRLNQWVCWQALPDESRPGKIRKIPINARTGGQAQSNNPDTWCGFKQALGASEKHSGIGFMFANGYFGVDIDGAEDAIHDYRNGETDNIVSEIIHTLQSYAEYSVSGNGLHIICRGKLPSGGRRKNNVEMYENARFFIMTGAVASEYTEIKEGSQGIKVLHEKYIGGGSEPTMGLIKAVPLNLSDSEIIRLAENSKQGNTFKDLYNGDWQGYFTSQSEADMSFCNMLAFWCGRDESVMDRIFRSSELMRDKWERKQSGSTYGKLTLAKAIKSCANVYEPKPEYSISIGAATAPREQRKLYSFDDTGNAQRFADTFGETVRYSYINKSWFYYDGRKWCQDITGAINRMADEVVETMRHDLDLYVKQAPEGVDAEDAEKQFLKHVKTSRSNKSKTAMLKETQHRVSITPDRFDKETSLLNVPNGIVNLRTGELLPHNKNKLITKITTAEYTDKIDAPLWEQFLTDVFNGDVELIRFVQKAIGYSLSGSTKEDCAFFCYGTGRNGKSTFLSVISEILGDYAANIQPETIMVKNVSGDPTSDIARLKGSRFVTAAEPNEGVRLNEGLVKQLTGGDRVTASKKYENEFEFYPEFKMWMSTNHKPVIRGTDIGIWSRIRLIPFTIRIPDEKMDRNLKHRLKQEFAGILKWAVDGCLLWQREGMTPPKAILDATAEYKNEMDVLSAFLDECCELGDGETQARDLFKAYLQWADENNQYKMTSTKFGREMTGRFRKTAKTSGNYYCGVKLKPEFRPYALRFG